MINFKILSVILAVASAFGIVFVKNSEIKTLKQQLTQANLNAEFEKLKVNECVARLEKQNEQIKAVALDNKKLLSEIDTIKQNANAKFNRHKPPNKDDKCQAKLEYYQTLFKELSDE